jgi:hypothetical protein
MGSEPDDDTLEDGEDDAGAGLLPVVPTELGIDPLLIALLHAAAFLDLSDDESVDPELAGDVLEHVGMYVQRLPPERLLEIESQLSSLSAHAEAQGWPGELVDFVASFLYNCGIGEEAEK